MKHLKKFNESLFDEEGIQSEKDITSLHGEELVTEFKRILFEIVDTDDIAEYALIMNVEARIDNDNTNIIYEWSSDPLSIDAKWDYLKNIMTITTVADGAENVSINDCDDIKTFILKVDWELEDMQTAYYNNRR